MTMLITSLLFDALAGALAGALTWIIFRRRFSAVAAGATVASACALLLAFGWFICRITRGNGLVGYLGSLLITPFSTVWFAGIIPSIPLAVLLQVVLMTVAGWLVWWRIKRQKT